MNLGKINLYQVLIGIAIGVIGSVGFMTLRNQTQPAPIIIEAAPTALPPEPPATPAPLSIFINGAVNSPGVFELPGDARVGDLVELAGGFASDAFVDGVNLAAPLFDGAQVFVPSLGDSAEIQQTLLSNPVQGTPPSAAPAASDSTAVGPDGIVNINTANRDQLETVDGVGPATAQSIISYREDNGPFTDIEEIMNVSGIGEGKFEQMRTFITVGP